MKLLILNEKPSAAKNFAAALGGYSGTFNNNQYDIVAAHGHLLQLVDPQEMVTNSSDKKRFADWSDLDFMPWPLDRLNWKTKPIQGASKTLSTIKTAAKNHDVIVIATDDDPSGEGDLLGWEIINYIGWHGTVWRIRFADELPKSIKTALNNPENATKQFEQPKYLKGKTRQQFDCAIGLQETRLTTKTAENNGFSFKKALNVGRLKTVIVHTIAQQNKLRKNWVKQPFYEVQFKDQNGNTFKREFSTDVAWRYTEKASAEKDLKNYPSSENIIIDSKQLKHSEPPKLVNLATLGALIQKSGFKTKTILDTYQKMYDDQVVSYPRTEDTKITQDQYDKLLPLASKIAQVVDVDSKLLTHTVARPKFITKKADHGANRPGEIVPNSLQEIEDKYGRCGVEIYKEVAKSYLAMLCEDYTYNQIKAHLNNNPEFKTTVNQPQDLNYKLVFNEEKLEDNKKDNTKQLGSIANSFIYEGTNTPPAKPNLNFIRKFLEKNSIGTGATQLSTISELSEGTSAQLKIVKGVYEVNARGALVTALTKNTWISQTKITKRLQDLLNEVEHKKTSPQRVMEIANQIIEHDKPIILQNINNMDTEPELEALASELKGQPIEKFKGTFSKNNQEVSIPITIYDGHKTTLDEQQQALASKTITYQVTNKNGQKEIHEAHLGDYTYKEKQYFGWIVHRQSLKFIFTDGKEYSIPTTRSGHQWTQDEINQLAQGNSVICENLIGKKGTYSAKLTFNPQSKYLFDMDFINKDNKLELNFIDGKSYEIYPRYFDHTWKESEIRELSLGNSVVIKLKSKKGRSYKAKIAFNPDNKYLFDREYVK
ncbi:DNA topoisomerase [Lactobacillus sp. ESL0681]|uniref:DNA topoisomerase n=1 Tax=Lactobacillus sp. ESL0681 TaxID=2983211 RepID=UPI0023F7F7C5|nr:DNA topoisomerase [Lactobacillus sp. ESL0681]WEV41285.1 DNA topoisomerase [Lactobacillus sp. ESL0681]